MQVLHTLHHSGSPSRKQASDDDELAPTEILLRGRGDVYLRNCSWSRTKFESSAMILVDCGSSGVVGGGGRKGVDVVSSGLELEIRGHKR